MSSVKPVTHVIFDVDGLLLDTESLYTIMMQKMADPFGKEFTWATKVKMMGRKEHDAAKIYIKELDVPLTVEDYLSQLKALMEECFPHAQIMPGAEKLVRHLHKHKIPIALATGSDSHYYQCKIKNHKEFFSLFHHAVFSSEDPDVKHGKPAPDCFLVANNRFPNDLNLQPQNALVFEDAPNGVQGALNAGMQVVWVPDQNCDQQILKDTPPTLTLRSLEDFKPEMFGLPSYDS